MSCPPTIVMPHINGLSLQDALASRPDLPWLIKLEILIKIGQIVSSGHSLPQTILHRDLKPTNIMIENFEYSGVFDPKIVVLDFDMSWHKGSKEKDVVFESRDDFGYLAPEQTDPSNRYTARSTRVDSYGYGMTMFYTFGREPPRPNEALSDQWIIRATKSTETGYDGRWKSAPNRVARIIVRATEIDQNMRVDFATMVHGLEFIKDALMDPRNLQNPELWAEEILAHSLTNGRYKWNDAVGQGEFEMASGVKVTSSANFRSNCVRLEIEYTDRGVRERGSLGKYLLNSVISATQDLREVGWKVLENRSSSSEAAIRAECDVNILRNDPDKVISAGKNAVERFII